MVSCMPLGAAGYQTHGIIFLFWVVPMCEETLIQAERTLIGHIDHLSRCLLCRAKHIVGELKGLATKNHHVLKLGPSRFLT